MAAPLSLLLWHLGRRGGGPRYTLELARALSGREDVSLSLALSQQSDLFAETVALGLPTLAIRTYHSAAGFAAGLLRLPSIAGQLAGFVRQQRAQVALCSMAHLWNPLLVGSLKRQGARNVLVVHDAAPHPGDEAVIRGRLLRLDFRQADLLVSLTEAVGRRLVEQQGVPAAKIIASSLGPFRYQDAAAARQLGAAPYQLLFFGRLLPYKGIENLIEAMRLLWTEDFPARLRIVGQGPLELGALPDNTRLERRWVAEAEVAALFNAVDLVVLPYQEASQSGVLPIARHLALPALVTPVGGLLQQVGHGASGFVADDGSAPALARAIRQALSNPAAYAALSARLASAAEGQEWDAIAAALVADLRRLSR